MNRLSVELEGAASLLSTASQVQTAGFPVVPGIGRGVDWTGGRPVIVTVHVPIVIRATATVRQAEIDLARAVAVRMRGGDRRAGVRVRVAEAVAVRRRREMT